MCCCLLLQYLIHCIQSSPPVCLLACAQLDPRSPPLPRFHARENVGQGRFFCGGKEALGGRGQQVNPRVAPCTRTACASPASTPCVCCALSRLLRAAGGRGVPRRGRAPRRFATRPSRGASSDAALLTANDGETLARGAPATGPAARLRSALRTQAAAAAAAASGDTTPTMPPA